MKFECIQTALKMAVLIASHICMIISAVFIADIGGFVADSQTHTTGCRDNWVAYDGSCYLFVHHNYSFTEAAHFCQIHESHLVHVDSALENAFIKDRVRYIIGPLERWWIGLTDEIVEGDWRWLDTDIKPAYTDWNPGEPNNSGGENCGVLQVTAWNDVPCSQSYRPICEKRGENVENEILG
ncbi:asialoglycoprotein receptor 1-like [Mercenaria mercenaria]|uniref:asialoglycoprotein receptor 1-like n=1 Tax=Mercenaria mercenaria TaxID=6596 RepID=UPI00234F350A|nr:asialoglycoprotein receptor 1-like [Mercenaria mercenaria]XP_053383017.1 asialoglycoprotein receptor 1-like [Mercenaria mercenaria]